jgi:lipopolysaccharide biosynthesis glycosyltransferase
MLIDLAKWRCDDITGQLLRCLHDNRRHVRWWDQYALNVVLADKWGELDCRWNQTSQIYRFPSWDRSPLDETAFEQLRNGPFIVHFNTRCKPWHLGCEHPLREAFFKYVDMTPWAGVRPTRRPWSFARWRRERVEDLLVLAGRRYRWLDAHFR